MALRKRRIEKQFQSIQNEHVPGCSVQPVIGSEQTWNMMLEGPLGTPYADGFFFIRVTFPNDCPKSAPNCTFQTRIYHPNVHNDGKFCIQILNEQWSPSLIMSKIILTIQEFLVNPINENCCCIPEIAEEIANDRKTYEKKAKQWTAKYAT